MPNYGLSGKVCVKCACGVATCPSATTATCLAGFDLSGGKCSCKAGTTVDSSCGSCISCSSNCEACSSSSKCTKCVSPYTLKNDACVFECVAG